jgi:class 3 adenylate cyclase/tetratricopeptide (TPR) repeat protein
VGASSYPCDVSTCERCGRENPEEARFCNGCGAELGRATSAAVEERKVVTVLFADITGSTALGERLDAEALKEVMGAFFAAMRAEIEAEGGTVEKFIGDAIMAAFGVPRVHGDDPARALRAALRMRARLAQVNEELDARYGVTLELRIGVNTGFVMAVTEPRPGEALATGDAVNAAARLEQAAQPGQVLVSERTAQAAPHFRFGSAHALELRGRAEPLRALELETEQPITEGTLAGLRTPLVGRSRELELLSSTYRRTTEERRPHLVTLYGEAGVGKSRLVAELLAGVEAAAPSPRVMRGRCLSYGDGISYWPLAEILKAYAQALDTDSAEVARAGVLDAAAAALSAAGADAPGELAAVLTASIGLAPIDHARGSPQELRAETQFAWRAFFSALASVAPTVVLVEDVQWADAAVLDLLEDVAAHAGGPLFVLCTARPELTARRPTWGGGRRSFTGLAVEPLDAGESARLAELLLGSGVSANERTAIVARAEGNPFFLEEIARTRAASAPGANGLPDTVHAALAARVDLLPTDEKRVLQTAAVVGRVFWPTAVAEIAALDPGTVSGLVDRLQDRDLVLSRLSSSMSGQRELIFKHALICEVAYESLPRRDRVRMHSAAADWIEQTYAGRRDEVVELIAHHRAAAYRIAPTRELQPAAFDALADAAEGAYARAGFERALSLGRAALEVASAPLERARALEAIGHASFVTYDGSAAWEALREAADIVRSETPGDSMRLASICGFAVMIPTRGPGLMRIQPPAEEVLPYLQLGLACAGQDDSEALALLLASQGYWAFGYGIDPADESGEVGRSAAERARRIARRIGRPDLELTALDSISSGLNIRGLYGLVVPLDRERLELARALRDPFEVGDSFYTAAWSALAVGHFADVVALAAEFEAMDLDIVPLGHLSLAALARVPLGDWDGALADQARLCELLGERADRPPSMASGGYGAAAFILEARGDRASADAVLGVIEAWDAGGEWPRRWATPLAGSALARKGDFAAARRTLDKLLDSRPLYLGRELEARCTLIAEERSWDEVGDVVVEARRHAETAQLLALPLHADRLEGRALLAAGDADAALPLLERALEGFAALSAVWEVALTELSLGEALAASDRAEDAAKVIARAAEVFERLGVPRELERARALLAGLALA